MELPVLHAEVAEFTSLCSLLRDSHCLQAAVKFAYPAFDEHGNECSKEHDSETSIEKSIDNNNVLWRGEVVTKFAGECWLLRCELRLERQSEDHSPL